MSEAWDAAVGVFLSVGGGVEIKGGRKDEYQTNAKALRH